MTNEKIVPVQMARGLAAIMVVCYHMFLQMERLGYEGPMWEFLAFGVDIFFVISGFIMWEMTRRAPTRTGWQFLKDRFWRISPLYYAVTTLVVVLMVATPGLLQTTRFDLQNVVSSYLYWPTVKPSTGSVQPVISPGWTLNLEMAFYVLFALSMALWQTPWRRAAFMLIVLTLAGMAGLFATVDWPTPVRFYTDVVVPEFGLGIIIALVAWKLPKSLWGWPLIVTGLLLLPATAAFEAPVWLSRYLPASLVVFGAVVATPWRSVSLELVGDASYSIYLTHFLTMSAAGQIARRAEMPLYVFSVFSLVLCLAVGIGCYLVVERPLARAVKGIERRQRATA